MGLGLLELCGQRKESEEQKSLAEGRAAHLPQPASLEDPTWVGEAGWEPEQGGHW